MFKIYGSEMCPDCKECKKNFDLYNVEYEFIDINKNLHDLSEFLYLRDTNPVFDYCKQIRDIGLPALVYEDGTITLDWEKYLRDNGHEPVYGEIKQSCSLDRKGC